jgi:hypothetical protein
MAKIPDGILGPIIGKIGPVTGYRRNGVNIIRSSAGRKDKVVTPLRSSQRQKIKVCNEFTRAFSRSGFFAKTFPGYGDTGTGYNRATSAIMNLAITGFYPDIALDYPKVLISKGPLPGAEDPAAFLAQTDTIHFTWTNNSWKGTAKPNDKVIVAAYFLTRKQAVFSIGDAVRSKGEVSLFVGNRPGEICETWIGFLSHNEKDAANSSYCGRIIL